MKRYPVSMVVAAGLLGGAAQAIIIEGDAHAQSSTSGAVRGIVTDKATGEPVIGATVVITGPALQGQQAEITDENGQYQISNLPPGTFTITVFYNDAQFSRPNVLIQVGKQAVVNVGINTEEAVGGETIVVEGRAPIVDQGSTKTGVTITSEYTENVPVGRTFGAVLGAAAGSQGDTYGISIGGSTSVENTYIVEGINTTDTGFGLLSSNLPNEFVQETEVITGGYNAEFGRATGGVINVVTKQGSNEFHGSVYTYFTPGALAADAEPIARSGTSISTETNLDYAWDIGAEVGGPIIKDKLWFHVGLNPSFRGATIDRIVTTRVDRDGMPGADRDPETGFFIQEEVGRTANETVDSSTYYFTAKINGALSEDHQYQVSTFGNPRSGTDLYRALAAPDGRYYDYGDGAYDVAAKWTSKFADGKTQVDAVVGFHRGFENQDPHTPGGNASYVRYDYNRPITDFGDFEQVPDACVDGTADDPFPDIVNCPVTTYNIGGNGFFEDRTNDRISGVVSVTQRVKAAGYHAFKAGLDVEISTYDSTREYTGTALYQDFGGLWLTREFLTFDENGDRPCADQMCSVADALTAETTNRSIGAYIQDSWQVRPNFTINAGLRWERQTAYAAEGIQGRMVNGETVPDVAFELDNMLAPRIGFIYDPTSEGRAKIMGHYGRFYENVPMDINVRAFGGEITDFNLLLSCPSDTAPADLATCEKTPYFTLGGGTEYVSPGLGGQYTEDIVIGGEYELMPDFKMGLTYIHRSLPRVIEDVSTDGGTNYLITNPGEDFSAEADDLRAEADRLEADGMTEAANLYRERAGFLDAVGDFDKPYRIYDAIQLTANQRFSKNAMLIASYTYSRSKGNFPGLFSTETGQLDPNLTSMYDLADLMANRFGPLGLDRPHNVKLDGFYQFDLKDAGLLILGSSFRAQSGIPHNTLAAHPVYGNDESYVLPRGSAGRSPLTWEVDVKVAYGRKLGKDRRVEAFVDVFNLFNNQEETDRDERYTLDNMTPIVGGDESDLRHGKIIDPDSLEQVNSTATPYANYNNVNARQAPLSVRFGVRLSF